MMSTQDQATPNEGCPPPPPDLHPRTCPICGDAAPPGRPFFDRNLDPAGLSNLSYASRKTPEYMCFAMRICPACDLVYACESPDLSTVSSAYEAASFDSGIEAAHAAEAYEATLAPFLWSLPDQQGLLEIGTGTGIFLVRMGKRGFTELCGVEPSRAAVDAADSEIRPSIREGIFRAADWKRASFSLIACFMTLEHVSDPRALVEDCLGLLKPGGMVAVVVHDRRAWNNRILGRRSPIVDIEHLQLFSRASAMKLFEKSGYTDIACTSFRNTYRLDYWVRLFPFPGPIKKVILKLLGMSGLAALRVGLNVGNLCITAHAPRLAPAPDSTEGFNPATSSH